VAYGVDLGSQTIKGVVVESEKRTRDVADDGLEQGREDGISEAVLGQCVDQPLPGCVGIVSTHEPVRGNILLEQLVQDAGTEKARAPREEDGGGGCFQTILACITKRQARIEASDLKPGALPKHTSAKKNAAILICIR
jgi:hypothetical protein